MQTRGKQKGAEHPSQKEQKMGRLWTNRAVGRRSPRLPLNYLNGD